MKIQLDTVGKTIKLEDSVKLSVLVKTLEELLPKGLWKDFTLETHTVINNWSTPYIVEKYYPRREWWENPWICYSGTDKNIRQCKSESLSLNNGVYNIEA